MAKAKRRPKRAARSKSNPTDGAKDLWRKIHERLGPNLKDLRGKEPMKQVADRARIRHGQLYLLEDGTPLETGSKAKVYGNANFSLQWVCMFADALGVKTVEDFALLLKPRKRARRSDI